jgi:hypothetical protein
MEVVELLAPRLRSRLLLYDDSEPIFEHFSIENEIDRLLKRKVWLKSGGHITIDETEALTTIDVNTGKFIGSTSLSDTILKTNLDAAQEIARQLRLRDIGGIIIIDFIDMSGARDRSQVVNALDRALKKDRTRTKISNISPLGLIEMTRKRTGETISELISEACPYCQGRGHILSPESISINIERELMQKAAQMDDEAFIVTVNPEVAEFLIGPRGEAIELIEQQIRRAVYVRGNHEQHIEKYDIQPGDLVEIEKQMLPFRKSQIVECEVVRNPNVSLPRAAAWTDGYMVDLANGGKFIGQRVKARLTSVSRSYAEGEALSLVKGEHMNSIAPKIERAATADGDRDSRRRSEREPQPRGQRELQPREEREPQPRPEREPQPRAQREPQPRPDREPQPREEREAEPRPEREPQPRGQREPQQSRPERVPQPRAQREPQPRPEREPQPRVEQEAEPREEREPRPRSRRPSQSRRGRGGGQPREERELQPREELPPQPIVEPEPQPVDEQESQPVEGPPRRSRSRGGRSRSRSRRPSAQSEGGEAPPPGGDPRPPE